MSDQNPLQVSIPVSNEEKSNRSGRPTIKNIIKFGPQPTSIIITQILNERKKKAVLVEAKDETFNFINESARSPEIDEDIYICSTCSHRTNSSKEHAKHLKKHKQYSCNYTNCTYTCKISSNLIKHKRVHTNEKPYLCEKCCFRSNFVNSLKAHTRIHTAERPYQCVYCSYKCNSSSNLKKHMKHKHPDTSKLSVC